MAKHKKGRKHRRLAGFAGLGNMKTAGALGRDVLPGVIGIGLAVGGAIATRAFIRPDMAPGVYRYAPLIAGGVGALVGGAAASAIGGKGQAIAVASASILSGTLVFGTEALNAARPGAMAAIANVPAALPAGGGTAGLGALVAETRGPNMHGVVMQPRMGGDFGENVRLQGAMNPGAFGRPQANVG